MAGEVRFRLEGAAEMERLLKELGPRVARRVAASALRAGARPIIQRAKELVPVRTGELRDSITLQTARRAGPESRVVQIGFRRPTSRRAHLTEYGTAHSAAKPFMRPAMDERAPQALDEIGRVLGVGIDREAEKLAGIFQTRKRGR